MSELTKSLQSAGASPSGGATPVSGVRALDAEASAERALETCRTLAQMFLLRVQATPRALAYQYPSSDDEYSQLTWAQAGEQVRALACGLLALGLVGEDRCAIIANTCIEWILADLAVLCCGGATTTVYPTSTEDECRYILSDSESVVAFVQDLEQLEKLRATRARLPRLRQIVLIQGAITGDPGVLSWPELLALGKRYDATHPNAYEQAAASVTPDQLATLVYTSGTTGVPKGVRLSHDGWVYQAETGATLEHLLSPADHQYLWLPLSHVFGKVLELSAIRVGFPTTVDCRVPRLLENLPRVRPTFMGAPPRIFEKLYAKIVLAAEQRGGLKARLFRWARRVGFEVSSVRRRGQQPGKVLRLRYALADRLVFAKLRARFGGRMRFMFSGSAALSEELAAFFHSAGLLVLEGYGLTESSAGAVCNRLDAFAFGSVGKPLPGTQLKLDTDGEILLKSRGVMRGYHNLPAETAATLTADGWLRTGDIGHLDERGFLYIKDRKKDLIRTSTGLYVAPQKLESLLKAHCPYIAQSVVHGDGRKYCSALITLDNDLLSQAASPVPDGANAASGAHATALVHEAIARVNATVAAHERIERFAILATDLSVENQLLTSSMKVRRRLVEQRYASLLDSLYDERAANDRPPAPRFGTGRQDLRD